MRYNIQRHGKEGPDQQNTLKFNKTGIDCKKGGEKMVRFFH